jgi:hypothetical protein
MDYFASPRWRFSGSDANRKRQEANPENGNATASQAGSASQARSNQSCDAMTRQGFAMCDQMHDGLLLRVKERRTIYDWTSKIPL